MSCIYVIRHGQASAGTDDYDRLSDLGKHQARILGEHWAAHGLEFERVVAGTHRRQLETAQFAGRAFEDAGGSWPEPEPSNAFDEHSGYAVVVEALETLRESDPKIAAWVDALETDPKPGPETFWAAFRYITRRWAQGELALDGNRHEPWAAFRSRVEAGLVELASSTLDRRNVAVFTSAGPSGVAAAAALGLAHGPAIELSWRVQNSAVTEVVPDAEGLRLKSFNSASHLPNADLVTMI